MPHSLILTRLRATVALTDAPTKRLAAIRAIVDDIVAGTPGYTMTSRTNRALRRGLDALTVAGAQITMPVFHAEIQRLTEVLDGLDPSAKYRARIKEEKRAKQQAEAVRLLAATPGAEAVTTVASTASIATRDESVHPAQRPTTTAEVTDPWDWRDVPPQEKCRLLDLEKRFGKISNEQLLTDALNGRANNKTNLLKLQRVLQPPSIFKYLTAILECYLT
jgi:hypothetical protein